MYVDYLICQSEIGINCFKKYEYFIVFLVLEIRLENGKKNNYFAMNAVIMIDKIVYVPNFTSMMFLFRWTRYKVLIFQRSIVNFVFYIFYNDQNGFENIQAVKYKKGMDKAKKGLELHSFPLIGFLRIRRKEST